MAFPILPPVAELEAFIDKWRAELQPQHGFLFSQ